MTRNPRHDEPLTCQQVRDLDAYAIQRLGIPGVVLMENAGRNAAEFILRTLADPDRHEVVVLCGPGNNGGDGFVIARHLHNAAVKVRVILATAPEKIRGDAAINLAILERMGLELLPAFEPDGLARARESLERATVIIDALLGTGSTGAPRGVIAQLVRWANAVPRAHRVAIDIPSGLDADRGQIGEPCFRAATTITMVAPKIGFLTPAARDVLGEVVVVDIGAPPPGGVGEKSSATALDS